MNSEVESQREVVARHIRAKMSTTGLLSTILSFRMNGLIMT